MGRVHLSVQVQTLEAQKAALTQANEDLKEEVRTVSRIAFEGFSELGFFN